MTHYLTIESKGEVTQKQIKGSYSDAITYTCNILRLDPNANIAYCNSGRIKDTIELN
jgi:hypothetical protein